MSTRTVTATRTPSIPSYDTALGTRQHPPVLRARMMRVSAVRTITGIVSSPSTTVDTPADDQLAMYNRDVLSALADAEKK
ncbi:hypothetical protein E2C01_025843 [Portunus trituberculatus]|uniref:Uncharacterized protein n=1 Tax=Portunus trituberculatus TaxID=210409 RepID=A0A5B7EEB4_PORTR|nr:hypothetical protein [Portunus trituberculatus]